LKGGVALDTIGVLAALGSAISLALGGVLIQKWGQPMSLTGFTAWQLLIASGELGVVALLLGDVPSGLTAINNLGLLLVALVLTSLPFYLWFKGIQVEGAANVAPFFLLTPTVAFVLDALVKGIVPTAMQLLGVALVITGLILNIYAARKTTARARVQQVEMPEQAVID